MSEVQFKDSGLDWIGAVPIDWEVTRLKSVSANAETGKRPPDESEEVLSIGGEHIQEGMFYLENPRYVSFETFKGSKGKIHIGDLLIVKDGATIGKCMYVNTMPEERMLLNEHVYRMGIEKFFYYWIETTGAQFWFRSNNMSTAQESIPQNTLYSLPVVVPRKATREKISCYLDEKTAAIDGKVAVLEKKLAAYKRLKKSIINRAVTRGLDPNVKLKDSGVDWIGQVPERWKIFRLKDLISSVDSGGTPKATNEKFYSDSSDGVPWVTIADMSSFDYVIETQKHLTDAGVQDKNLEVYPIGTVLYSMYATIGKVSELAIPATINQAMLAIQNNWRSHKSYFKYSLRAFELWVSAYTTESTQKNLNADRVRRFLMPTPPLAEQQAIADYLDVECAKIDKAEEIVEKQIDAYKRLKRSLINEVVTGKRKVA